MRNQKWREQFIADMAREGQSIETARAFLRIGTTLQRLAEAQCNGDWPADNGERAVTACSLCQGLWVKSSMRARVQREEDGRHIATFYRCQNCCATERAKRMVPEGWSAEFQGDPRGCIITLKAPSGREIGVP